MMIFKKKPSTIGIRPLTPCNLARNGVLFRKIAKKTMKFRKLFVKGVLFRTNGQSSDKNT